MNMFLAGNASSHNSSPHYYGSQPEHHSLDMNYKALPGEKYGDEKRGKWIVDRLVPLKYTGDRLAQQIETGIRQTGSNSNIKTTAKRKYYTYQKEYDRVLRRSIMRLTSVQVGVVFAIDY